MKAKDYKGGLFVGRKPEALYPGETALSRSIADWLDAKKIYNDRLQSGSVEVIKKIKDRVTGQFKHVNTHWMRLCKKGTPDRFAIYRGVIVFIEVKTLKGKLSPEQIERQAELRGTGAQVINPRKLEDVINFFETLKEEIATNGKN